MKARRHRLFIGMVGVLLVFMAGIVAFALLGNSSRSSARPIVAATEPEATTSSSPASGASSSAPRTAGAPPPPSSPLLVRSPEESQRLKRRHTEMLQSMGLPVRPVKPRIPLAKEVLQQPPGREHLMLVKFCDDLMARSGADGSLVVSAESAPAELRLVLEQYGLRFTPSQTAPAEEMVRLEARAMANTQTEAADLGGLLTAHPARSDAQGIWAAAQAMQKLDVVEFVALSSIDQPPPPPLPYDITPPSALLSTNQGYRTSAGINIDAAWSDYGARGQGVQVINCEYNYNASHEDLRNMVSQQPWVTEYYTYPGSSDNHGTAVLGILAAAENNYGMTGTLPEADVRFYGEYSKVNGQTQYRPATITAALAASTPGDVVLLEMQARGFEGTDDDPRYVPAEYDQSVWIAVKTGTDAGIHVIAAAGNGGLNDGEDLDSDDYAAYRNRGDSGAIIVGAGTQARVKTDFSTFGSRVNLQAWGNWSVATLGEGSVKYGNDHNQAYTFKFSGTSAASPIVTSAVGAVESIARPALGRPLTPMEMRQLLINNGKPQTGDISKNIGPLPDVPAALADLLAGFPTITSITPEKGDTGTSVTLTGTGFTGATTVTFGGVTAGFTVVNATTINATVPAEAHTGRLLVTTPAGSAASVPKFQVIAGADTPLGQASPSSLPNFTSQQGAPSTAKIFTVTGHNLNAGFLITAPAGYEVSLDSTNFTTATNIPAAAPVDTAANYAGNWISGDNAGLGFSPWSITAHGGTNYYAGNLLGNPSDADITDFGVTAFTLYAKPKNSPAATEAARPLARPLKIGDTLQFQWAINEDANSPTGAKGFTLRTGGPEGTELVRVDQSDAPGAVLFASPAGVVDTEIAHGTAPMTWSFTRSGTNSLQITATGRDGSTNIAFSTNVAIPGAPDVASWYASRLDSNPPEDANRRQPYFNNLGISPASPGGGSVPTTTVQVRLAASAPSGSVGGNVTVSSADVVLQTVALSGSVAPHPAGYEAWAESYGLNPLTDGAWNQDPDKDGLTNLTEFAFGSSPIKPTGSLCELRATQNERILTFVARTAGVLYEIQTRPDLNSGSWTSSGLTPNESPDQTGVPSGYHRMECIVPNAARAFYRILSTVP